MRRIIGTFGIIGILLVGQVFAALVANAQPAGMSTTPSDQSYTGQFEQTLVGETWSTSFQIQNLGTTTANVTITYYNQDGTVADTEPVFTIPAGGSVTRLQKDRASLPAGFDGSAVISADQPIATILNQQTDTGAATYMSGSAIGWSGGATVLNLPLIMKDNYGWTTNFHLQNADTADANISIVYTPMPGLGTGTTVNDTIKPGASKLYKQSTMTELGTRFVGSAKVTSTNGKKMAATINETNGAQILVYDGFTSGGTNVALPLIMKGNYGWYTAFQIQNTSSTNTATGTITFKAGVGSDAGKVGTSVPVPFSIPANGSITKIQKAGDPTDSLGTFTRFVGAASITSDQAVTVIVNEHNMDAPSGQEGMSYSGFNVAAATANINLPLIMKGNYGWYTSFQIQNTSTTTAATGTINYVAGPGSDAGKVGPSIPFTIPAGSSITKIQMAGNSSDDLGIFTRFVGSATITADQPIVTVVNEQQSGGTADVAMSYNGLNQ